MNWKKLQNGSDIRGVALEGIEGENVNLTEEVIMTIGKSFVCWLRKTMGVENPTIAVGMDCRLSGNAIKGAFIKGATEAGANVVDCGLASTPAMFMTTISDTVKATASVMVTASHLPFNRNGLKFFTPKGGLDSKDIAAILEIAENGEYAYDGAKGNATVMDFMSVYSRHIADYIREGVKADDYDHPLKGMHIIVDAGNGNGGFFEKILRSLGANTEGSQFLEPDGHFPNHIPNPENAEAMASVCNAVETTNADLGVIFDTDVDRSAIIGRKGEPINRNSLIALISAVILEEHPGSTIVTDSVTSDGLAEYISSKGGKHHRFRRGYKNVINEGIRLNENGEECWLAIETSGHAALRENHFLDDGAYLAAKLIVHAAKMNREGKQVHEIIASLKQPKESKEIRIKLTDPDFKAYGAKVLEDMKAKAEEMPGWTIVQPNYEGLRVSCTNADEDGWWLLRMSLHDPVMPLNIESNVEGGVEAIERKLKAMGLL
ncbi:phosphomannomutase/phosphoglucomutase [uncultured Prevotella sp.]|uniref:phosphomannomutase/phosphoglucomutase n=1 Tax=uncultured Prevotella sp. TaxID=159272 RepID=UPI0027E2237D|nr:phosphomannomutase/phosphoglucomutase [uncultured Prevotella sp.]